MSTARNELLEVVRKVAGEYFEDPDDYEDHIKPLADDILAALAAGAVTEGWLITGKRILKVEETSLTDPGDENWTYVAYCEPPEGDEGDDEEEENED